MKCTRTVLSIVLCFLFIFSMFHFSSSASDETDFKYTIHNGTIKITKCLSKNKEIIIPDTIDGYNVTAIDFMAFSRCLEVEKIIIGKNVQSIGDGVFSNCISLKSIIVSDDNSAYSVEDDVLFNKSKTEILCYPAQKSDVTYKMPDTVNTIKTLSFSKCAFLEEVEVSKNLSTISSNSFISCESLNSIYIYPNVENIEQGAIRECSNNYIIYFYGSKEKWNSIKVDSDTRKQLAENVVCKDADKEIDVNLTDNFIELLYSSKVPFEFKISDNSIVKMTDITTEKSSRSVKVTAKVKPQKLGETIISAVADNGFVLCDFKCKVVKCMHPNLYFLRTEQPASCTENGKEIYACDLCDYIEYRKVEATGHTFGEWKVEVKATKDKEGLEVRSCSCGETETKIIPKKSLIPESDNVTNENALIGDVNNDNRITATDARMVLRHVAGLETLSGNSLKLADVDANNKINATDARRILRHVAGLEKL